MGGDNNRFFGEFKRLLVFYFDSLYRFGKVGEVASIMFINLSMFYSFDFFGDSGSGVYFFEICENISENYIYSDLYFFSGLLGKSV